MADDCLHDDWDFELDHGDPADADGIPVCNDCGFRLDTSPPEAF